MNKVYDLKSILNAIEEINSKKKNKPISFVSTNIDTTQEDIVVNDGILPITEKLILEAEEYSKKFKNNSSVFPVTFEDVLILDKEYSEKNSEIVNLEQIKNLIIDDLYSTLSSALRPEGARRSRAIARVGRRRELVDRVPKYLGTR